MYLWLIYFAGYGLIRHQSHQRVKTTLPSPSQENTRHEIKENINRLVQSKLRIFSCLRLQRLSVIASFLRAHFSKQIGLNPECRVIQHGGCGTSSKTKLSFTTSPQDSISWHWLTAPSFVCILYMYYHTITAFTLVKYDTGEGSVVWCDWCRIKNISARDTYFTLKC
jgi:hypothetical protein